MINVDWTLAASAGIFLVCLYGLNVLLFKPLFQVLEERRSRTVGFRREAQNTLDRFHSLLDEHEEALKAERQAGYRLAESTRKEALEERQRMLAEARGQAQTLMEEARGQVQKQLEASRQQLKKDADEISAVITARILGRA